MGTDAQPWSVTWEVHEEMEPICPPQFSAPPEGQEIRKWCLITDPLPPPHLFTIQQALSIASQCSSPEQGPCLWQSEGRYEAAELRWARRRTKWPRNLGQFRNHSSSVLDGAHSWSKSWDSKAGSRGFKRWRLPECTHHSAAETGLRAVWGCWWRGDVPTPTSGTGGVAGGHHVHLWFPVDSLLGKIFSNLFFGSQSAKSHWELGRTVAQTFHRQMGSSLSPWHWSFLWPQHPSEGRSPRWV